MSGATSLSFLFMLCESLSSFVYHTYFTFIKTLLKKTCHNLKHLRVTINHNTLKVKLTFSVSVNNNCIRHGSIVL